MEDHLHKGWPWTFAVIAGSIATWTLNQWVGLIVGIVSLAAALFAINTSLSTKDAAKATKEAAEATRNREVVQLRLMQLQSNAYVCQRCMDGVEEPDACPHSQPPYPKHCKKRMTK